MIKTAVSYEKMKQLNPIIYPTNIPLNMDDYENINNSIHYILRIITQVFFYLLIYFFSSLAIKEKPK